MDRSPRRLACIPAVVALALAGCGGERVPAAAGADADALAQQVATLRRSDQISREANAALQKTLAERDEEIAGLRADVAFYERLVGATAQRRGLSVHELQLVPQPGGVWHFTGTLTQNLSRDAVSEGAMTLAVEGSRDGRLQRLDWAALRQSANPPGVPYSFKYFQQVEGEVFLPAGFTPARVSVRLTPRSGSVVEHSMAWAEATTARTPGERPAGA